MTKLALSIAAALTFTAMTFGAADASPNSYPLICNGGGNMQARIRSDASIQVKFAAGSVAGAPQPGECTWIDRGFRPGEPTVLLLRHDRRGMDYLLNGMLGNGRFFVHAHNDNAGSMVITRIGP